MTKAWVSYVLDMSKWIQMIYLQRRLLTNNHNATSVISNTMLTMMGVIHITFAVDFSGKCIVYELMEEEKWKDNHSSTVQELKYYIAKLNVTMT